MSENFLEQRYQELQAIERTAFSVVPLPMSAIKSGIKDVALPIGATVAATHIPVVGPAVAATIGQGAHLASAGTHVLANAGMAHVGAQIASALPTGLGIQSTAAAIGGATNTVALGIVDGSSYAVGGVAAAAMMGKTIVNSGKLAFDKATSQPISQSINQTWGAIYQAATKTAEVLKGLRRQVNQFINRIQGRDMAEELNQAPVPNEPDSSRRAEYVRMLSENQNDPSLTYESIQEKIKSSPDLGTDYDKQVASQALKEGKSPDEVTAILSQGPNVAQMSQTKLQNLASYLAEVTDPLWKQSNHVPSSPEVNQDQSLDPEAQTMVEANGTTPPPSPEEDDPEQSSTLDPDAQAVAESNGVVVEPPDPKLKEQYVQLLSENLEEPDLTWEDIQERVNQDPDLGFDYDQRVAFQAQENGIQDPDKLSDLIADSPEWDGVERPKPAAVEPEKPGLTEDNLEAYSMIKEDILDNLVRFNSDLGNLSIKLNGERVMGLGRQGAIMENKTSLTTEQAQLIRDALQNPKDHKDVEITIKLGTRVMFRLKNGVAQPDKFGIVKAAEELAAKIPKATPEQINNLTADQKKLIESTKKQGLPTENMINQMVNRTQTNKPTIPKTEEREVALSR